MDIVRYLDRGRAVQVGVRRGESITPLAVGSFGELWSHPYSDLPALLEEPGGPECSVGDVILLPPVDGNTEVWAAGVTYRRSRVAREEESTVAGVYGLVYEARRPELFFKSVAWRVVTEAEPVAIRGDSELNVPEAELALVINSRGEIVGYSVCNDMSSRSIEGENPLYLPQAKVYAGSCALAAGIRPAWEVPRADDLAIELTVIRAGETVWQAATSTASMVRTPEDLAEWLFAEQSFPDGAVLSTGTGLVPDLDFTLQVDDVVRIAIDQVGTLSNPVVGGKESYSWLVPSVDALVATLGDRRQRHR